MKRARNILLGLLALACALTALVGVSAPARAGGVEEVVKGLLPGETTTSTTQTGSESATSSQTTAAPEEASQTTTPETTTSSTATPTTSSTTTTTTTTTAVTPSVSSSNAQRPSGGKTSKRTSSTTTSTSSSHTSAKRTAKRAAGARKKGGQTAPAPQMVGGHAAPLPFSLRTPISGVPGLFIESLDVPPFLLPIYQAAGISYDVPWEVLAAINEVETDYGSDLSLSSAGAEGWMQFLPAEWRQYGVDVTGSGWVDPYNPADAIFAAARYLQAAGGSRSIRSAVFAYNHSQAYVEAVMLRAQLLERMPPNLLGAVTNLAEGRFPVHARSHFSDGFAAAPTGSGSQTLVGTTIYSEAAAPVIAVKDGTITAIGSSPARGRYISLRDADGNTYTYADLGSIASVYPLLRPRRQLDVGAPAAARAAAKPRGAASAGVQSLPPLSQGALTQGLALGAAARLEHAQPPSTGAKSHPRVSHRVRPVRSFAEGTEQVQLEPLRAGVHVIAGTVLGHLATGAAPHVLFQIKPAGLGAPLIDPKPVLDSWVQLEDTGVFAAKGESPFLATSPTAGQALFESAGTLGQQILRDRSIGLEPCERAAVRAGKVGRSALASIELLALSGLHPTVAHMGCDVPAAGGLGGYRRGLAYDITAVNGVQIAGHTSPGGVADATERKLMTLQGTLAPQQIAGPIDYPGAEGAVTLPDTRALVHVSFAPARTSDAHAASATASAELTANDWTALVERLGELPDVTVATQHSSAAVPDEEAPAGSEGAQG